MKIKNEPPPNYKLIKKHFPNADFYKGTVFTYGDTCYCKQMIPKDLIVHEETHTRQQKYPWLWWRKYIKDPRFRLSQELEAYTNQWNWIKKNVKDRNLRFRFREKILGDLTSKLYNNMISYSEAEKLFKRT